MNDYSRNNGKIKAHYFDTEAITKEMDKGTPLGEKLKKMMAVSDYGSHT